MTVILEAPTPALTTQLRGMEAQHVWTSPTGRTITLNDHSVWPQYRIDRIEGRHARADVGDVGGSGLKHDPTTARIGEIVRKALLRGKTEVWTGRVRAGVGSTNPMVDLRRAESDLIAAFTELGLGTMEIMPYPGSTDPSVAFEAEVANITAADEQTLPPWQIESGGFEREFNLELRLADPRYYEEVDRTVTTATLLPSVGLVLPAAFPAAIPGPDSMVGAVTVSTLNTWVDPIIDLTGLAPNPVISNDTLGQQIVFDGFTIRSGQTLRLDFKKRTMTIDGYPVDRSYVDWSVSGWWDAFVPGLRDGDNLVRYRADGADSGAHATVRWRNALSG